jgi:catechol 2,3-dioxygenase-like lactoylglutathione lyase family enzyme
MTIPARLGIVTLGVADLGRSVAFYEALGWDRCASSSVEITWFRTADTHIGLLKPATVMDWGGTSGYVADPDGHPWEIAHNPHFPIDAEGRVRIP